MCDRQISTAGFALVIPSATAAAAAHLHPVAPPPCRRQATCALVCKRWHRLVTTEPELLQEAQLSLQRSPAQESAADRLVSLLHGLRQLAPHVQRLSHRLSSG